MIDFDSWEVKKISDNPTAKLGYAVKSGNFALYTI